MRKTLRVVLEEGEEAGAIKRKALGVDLIGEEGPDLFLMSQLFRAAVEELYEGKYRLDITKRVPTDDIRTGFGNIVTTPVTNDQAPT